MHVSASLHARWCVTLVGKDNVYHFHGTRLHSRIFSLIFTWSMLAYVSVLTLAPFHQLMGCELFG